MIKSGTCTYCGSPISSTNRPKLYCGKQKDTNSCAYRRMREIQATYIKPVKVKQRKALVIKKTPSSTQREWSIIKKYAAYLNL